MRKEAGALFISRGLVFFFLLVCEILTVDGFYVLCGFARDWLI